MILVNIPGVIRISIIEHYHGSWSETPKKDDRWYGMNKGKSKRNKRK
jgi:hypothetical protein